MTRPHVMVVHVGPVQSWIASARTVRDLAFGSWVISELAKTVARTLHGQGSDLIFPCPENPGQDLAPGSDLNVSNRVVAVVHHDPEDLADQILSSLKTYLKGLFDQALGKLPLSLPQSIRQRAWDQLVDAIEFYWAAAPVQGDPIQAAEKAHWMLDLRKNTRDFGPWNGVPGLPKSSLDGFREAVVVVKGPTNQDSRKIKRYEARHEIKVLHERPPLLREGEALSGVDLFKRGGGYMLTSGSTTYPGVPSTSDVAAQPLVERLGNEKVKTWRKWVVQLLQDAGVSREQAESESPGVYFFVERISNLITGEDRYVRRRTFQKTYEEAWNTVLGEETPRPYPYYALLVADGDGMGELIDSLKTLQDQKDLTRRLAQFARKVKEIVDQHQGYAIYAGGDDVLALFPLHTVLDALREIDRAFSHYMQGYVHPRTQSIPTLSGGVVIAHHLTPLEDVLTRAREAERWAKEREGKHTLAMVLLRRSGEAARVRDAWPDLLSHVQAWVNFSMQGAIPRGLPYALSDLTRFLEGTDLPSEAVSAEVRRMFKQKRENKDKKLWEKVEHFVSDRLPEGYTMKGTLAVLRDMASEMRMAEELARVLLLSWKGKEGSA